MIDLEKFRILNSQKIWVSKGYNKGLNLALKFDYEYIVKLDCDIISENLLSGLIETFENNKYAVASHESLLF